MEVLGVALNALWMLLILVQSENSGVRPTIVSSFSLRIVKIVSSDWDISLHIVDAKSYFLSLRVNKVKESCR